MSIKSLAKECLFEILPIKLYLKFVYKVLHGKKLDIDNPKTFSEKLFWLKLYNGQELKDIIQKCYDKYDAREYIINKVGEEFLPKLYGIYGSVEDIDFKSLPQKYAIKITQSNGYNILNDGNSFKSESEVQRQLKTWLNYTNDLKKSRKRYKEESYYFNGKAKIICEEFLSDEYGRVPSDLRILCFNGEPRFVLHDIDSVDNHAEKKTEYYRNTYDLNWNFIKVNFGRPYNEEDIINKPANLDKMIDIAKRLSEDFVFARIDMYDVQGRIIIGEITWIPMGGGGKITPSKYDFEFGQILNLPKVELDYKQFKKNVLSK